MSLKVFFRLHHRLLLAAGIGVVVGLVSPESWGQLVRVVTGWNVAAGIYLCIAWYVIMTAGDAQIRRRAALQDESGWIILAVSAGTALVSLGAIVGLLVGFKDRAPDLKPVYIGLSIFTIFCSWFFLHTLFTLHYAHEFYRAAPHARADKRGGLQFAGNPVTPCYLDFAYYSFTIGMTAQTSDTAVTTPAMRRITLSHAILTFFFNTVILALTINIAASLL